MPHLPENLFSHETRLSKFTWHDSKHKLPWVSQNIMDTRTNFRHNPTYPCTPVLYQTPQIRLPSAALCACQGLVNIVPASQLIAGDHRDFQIVLSQNCSGTVVILCGWNVMVGSFIQTCGCKACQSAAKSVDLLPPVGNLKPPFSIKLWRCTPSQTGPNTRDQPSQTEFEANRSNEKYS